RSPNAVSHGRTLRDRSQGLNLELRTQNLELELWNFGTLELGTHEVAKSATPAAALVAQPFRAAKRGGGLAGLRYERRPFCYALLEREPRAESDLARRLNLRAGENLRRWLAEVRIRAGAEGERRPRVVVLHDLLVEQIEDVRQDGQPAYAAHFD